ncbi:MAG: hypothetical protein HYY16_08770 [Planctomycetes bacterium]|nr:hypothetical protein [Planctomycetota bacterium]
MRAGDSTYTGGPDRNFRTTIWQDILAAADRTNPLWREKLALLCQTYWKPVYAYIRLAWKKPVDEAKDLTQAFFTLFLEKDYLSRLRPERGSFRGYVKRAVHHFLINARESELVRQKHGRQWSFDATPAEFERLGISGQDDTPERAYDREWFRCVIDLSVEQLKRALESDGKAKYFEVFQAYCMDDPPALRPSMRATPAEGAAASPTTYRGIAERLGLQESDVRNYLAHCRRMLWQIVREHIRQYTDSDEQVDQELREAAQS